MAALAGAVVILAAAAALVLATRDDDNRAAARTVPIEMVDVAFNPEALEVRQGETVRFVFTNTGGVAHDAFIGNAAAQDEHEREMRDAEDGDGAHGGHADDDEGDAITVEPGGTGELTHTFDEPGELEIGCHQTGHYAAGMTIAVTVR